MSSLTWVLKARSKFALGAESAASGDLGRCKSSPKHEIRLGLAVRADPLPLTVRLQTGFWGVKRRIADTVCFLLFIAVSVCSFR